MQMYPGWSARDNYAAHKKRRKKRVTKQAEDSDEATCNSSKGRRSYCGGLAGYVHAYKLSLVVGYNVCLCISVYDIMCVYSFTACFLIIVMFRKSVCGLALVVRPHGHFNCALSVCVCVCIYMRSRLSLCCLYSIIACYSDGGSSCQ